ncbi:LANO_0G00562g1_1 [Lachancea nothofagi CBS 11611]|uniref:Protein PBN1 n=1 Tax=Lachancea nothofagi CBS 11611 TaxID=1266666 RepID=A0A1G4KE97_9SACH|nr:LANO_0G00562g1_1 [Lachancea nothofagi CBS 11611]
MSVVKSRITVLFDSLQDLEKISQNALGSDESSESLVIEGSDQLVQRRTTLDVFDDSGLVRITWKRRGADTSDFVLAAPLSDGLNVYVSRYPKSKPTIRGAINSAKYHLLHSDEFDKELLGQFLPSEFDGNALDWEIKNYDIFVGHGKLRVDEYYNIKKGQDETLTYDAALGKLEVGFFFVESSDEFDVNLNGARCIWNNAGFIEQCQKTYLFFQRAHSMSLKPSGTLLELLEPTGLHPIVSVDLTNELPSDNCDHFMYLTAPADLFIDKFESSPVFLAGAADLEAPEYAVRNTSWGMETLLLLEPGKLNEIKLHTRYVQPQEKGQFKMVQFTSSVFQACDSGNHNIHENPFYSKSLGFESLFTNDTTFRHLNSTNFKVSIPVGDTSDYEVVKITTWSCLILATVYLLMKVLKR